MVADCIDSTFPIVVPDRTTLNASIYYDYVNGIPGRWTPPKRHRVLLSDGLLTSEMMEVQSLAGWV